MRGDFVGQDTGGYWHSMEAKGRSANREIGLMVYSKQQASRVKYINNKTPQTKSGCISWLSFTPIEIQLDDPKKQVKYEETVWDIDRDKFWNDYYAPFISYLDHCDTIELEINGQIYRVAETNFMGKALKIGLLNEIIVPHAKSKKFHLPFDSKGIRIEDEHLSIGPDGILFGYDITEEKTS